jgi:hypothetical protein
VDVIEFNFRILTQPTPPLTFESYLLTLKYTHTINIAIFLFFNFTYPRQ